VGRVYGLLIPLLALGQSSELRGKIRDSSGSAVANAYIELRNQETGVQLKAKTGRDGEFRVVGIRAGLYQVTVQTDGFKILSRDGIRVKPHEQVQLNLILQPSALAQ